METKTMVRLRKKAPFFCRAKYPDGKFVHLDHPLVDGEGEFCAAHEKAAREARERFFNSHVKPVEKVREAVVVVRRIWP